MLIYRRLRDNLARLIAESFRPERWNSCWS
jgi:hypothetical protein